MTGREAFLDSSAIYALANRNDSDHKAVLAAYAEQAWCVTHSVILLEAFSLISKRIAKHVAVEVLDKFRLSPKVEVVPVEESLWDAGWRRCSKYADKDWDWIDRISFELMERRGIASALTLDRHFHQAGFKILC